jgi:hypothetical protein
MGTHGCYQTSDPSSHSPSVGDGNYQYLVYTGDVPFVTLTECGRLELPLYTSDPTSHSQSVGDWSQLHYQTLDPTSHLLSVGDWVRHHTTHSITHNVVTHKRADSVV